MLNLNGKVNENDVVWKVLIYDSLGQQIIAPLLRIGDLRENSITIHA
jgi:sec1 family domain-containing protein 1